ncbi:MAG: O-sialoglycoprotein endopeptidase [Clostridia bacterium]|nr:O-sialoglycoprotein endopeptidase [Clostridia bacterium]
MAKATRGAVMEAAMQASLGLDTSCYTTSVALVSGDDLVFDGRIPLRVPDGACGLRQSDALFQHVRNLPALIGEAFGAAREGGFEVSNVAASAWPRRAEGSYMPVFMASAGYGRSIASALSARCVEVSHQEGHIAAASWSAGMDQNGGFLALHLSGGTTELLSVHGVFESDLIGGTEDLNAGQFVDRVGVALGIPFPAGPGLEAMARGCPGGALRLPVAVRGLSVSFSGPCSAALRSVQAGARTEDIALAVFDCIGRSMSSLCAAGLMHTGANCVLAAGGVASNSIVREIMTTSIGSLVPGAQVRFAEPAYSGDNAVGAALLGQEVRHFYACQ